MPDNFDSICYTKNFLTEVIIRVDFQSPIEDLKTSIPINLSSTVKTIFPIPEPRKTVLKEIKISEDSNSFTNIEKLEYHFHSKDRTKTLVITPECIFIKYVKYENYEIIREDFNTIIQALLVEFEVAQPSRLGMRYINNIKFPEENPLDWNNYLNAKFLPLFDLTNDKSSLSRIFHNLEFNFDDFLVKFQFGMHNPDYPAKIIAKHFVLDLDVYKQALIEKTEILSSLDNFHKKIQEYFELSITENLRRFMNGDTN